MKEIAVKYPIAIEAGDAAHAFGVVVPDLPGCFSAGDTLDEAFANAKEAIELWLETVIDDGAPLPAPRPIAEHQANPEFKGWIWGAVDIDPSHLSTKAVRLNVSLPEGLVKRIDDYAKVHHMTRSGFLARAAIETMQRQ